jgi:hypothetical protein
MRRSELELISQSSHLLFEVSPPVVMRRSKLGLISWSSHLLLRCLRLSSWDGLNMDSYHGPHTFHPRCLRLSSWDGLNLNSYHGPHTFSWGVSACRHETVWTWTHIMVCTPSVWGVSACRHETVWTWARFMTHTPSCLRCLRLSSCGGLYLGSFYGPHTFYLRCLRSLSCGGLYLGSFHGPHTFYLRCLRPLWSGHILLYRGCLQWLQDSLPPCGLRRDHCHWSHKKRELRCTLRNPPSHFLCLELLWLSAW